MSSQPEREWELYETETKLPPRKKTLLCVTSCSLALCVTSCSLAVFFNHRPTPFVKHHLSLWCITLQAQGNRKPLPTSLNGCFHLPLHRFSTSLPMWCQHFLIKLYWSLKYQSQHSCLIPLEPRAHQWCSKYPPAKDPHTGIQ